VPLFPIVADIAVPTESIDALWRQVEALPHPGQPPAINVPAVQASQAAKSAASANHSRKIIASVVAGIIIAIAALAGLPAPLPLILFVGGIAAFFGLLRLIDKNEAIRGFEIEKNTASTRWTDLQRQWQERTSPQTFEGKKADLHAVRRSFGEIPNLRLRKLDQLRQNQRAIELATFLDQYEIQRAKISGIGPSRKQTLQSYGIETAADLNSAAITRVPGFGEKMADKLLAWRASLEKRFHFDPAKGIDPREIARVEQEVLVERRKLEDRMRTGYAELKQIHAQILATREHMMPQVAAAQIAYLQAEANYKAACGLG
jgi:DNA-binding helix-hairpin-helix protein with protein kinase domain